MKRILPSETHDFHCARGQGQEEVGVAKVAAGEREKQEEGLDVESDERDYPLLLHGTLFPSLFFAWPSIQPGPLLFLAGQHRETRDSVSLWKSRLFGMGRRPLHARIIVNSKEAQKPTFYLAFPPVSL